MKAAALILFALALGPTAVRGEAQVFGDPKQLGRIVEHLLDQGGDFEAPSGKDARCLESGKSWGPGESLLGCVEEEWMAPVKGVVPAVLKFAIGDTIVYYRNASKPAGGVSEVEEWTFTLSSDGRVRSILHERSKRTSKGDEIPGSESIMEMDPGDLYVQDLWSELAQRVLKLKRPGLRV